MSAVADLRIIGLHGHLGDGFPAHTRGVYGLVIGGIGDNPGGHLLLEVEAFPAQEGDERLP